MLDELSCRFINRYQGGMPLCLRPYARMARDLGCDEDELIGRIRRLLDEGWITRFGPFYDAAAMGGGLTLAALSVPEARFEAVTALVNAHPEVAHNYRRDHALNMWFVVATETPEQVGAVLADIENETGLRVYDCPKQREFYIGLQLFIDEDGAVRSVPLDAAWQGTQRDSRFRLDAADRRLVAATQAGFPLCPNPWETLSRETGLAPRELVPRVQALLDAGMIRRIGAAPNHYRLGLRGNGMTVWDVPDDRIEAVGKALGALDFVSHCYQRPRHLPLWPYNLFAMVHGHDREEVLQRLDAMRAVVPDGTPHEVLFSSAVLKKTGLRLAA